MRILFVDDEQRVLDGLRRMLRPLRSEWDVEFANGGLLALEALDKGHFDAVVTDMKMPVMDGVALLKEVSERHPHLLRTVLSGQSEKEAVVRSVGLAHQYVSKPCTFEELRDTLNQALSLRCLLSDPQLRELVSKIDTIPSIPALYLKLIDLLESPSPSLPEILDVVSSDMGMCAKILQVTNSAFFGRRQSLSDPGQAVKLLGLATLRDLVFTARIFKAFDAPGTRFILDSFWKHSLAIRDSAEQIAKVLQPQNEELHGQARVAGLLHKVGQLVLASHLPERYDEVLALMADEDLDCPEAERRVFQVSHAEFGACILAMWGLPDPVVEAAAFHQEPSRCPGKSPNLVLTAVHLANRRKENHEPMMGLGLDN